MKSCWIQIGAILAALGVVLGAFGAHALAERLDAPQLEIWRTATHYHLVHALALVAVGLVAGVRSSRAATASGVLFLSGIVLFSGSLYALCLSGVKVLGAITPFGGVAFIAGWIVLAVAARGDGHSDSSR